MGRALIFKIVKGNVMQPMRQPVVQQPPVAGTTAGVYTFISSGEHDAARAVNIVNDTGKTIYVLWNSDQAATNKCNLTVKDTGDAGIVGGAHLTEKGLGFKIATLSIWVPADGDVSGLQVWGL